MLIFEKSYAAEELSDLDRDMCECFDERFNPVVGRIPTDECGFQKGKFTVTVTWVDEE